MIRYPHYWWGLTGTKYPSRIAVLDCDSVSRADPRDARIQTEELTRWCLLTTELKRGVPVLASGHSGDTVSALWDRISALLCSKDRTWIFASPASRILPLVKFWGGLEHGWITLAGHDWRVKREAISSGEGRTDSVLIVEDPPTVIPCHYGNRPGRMVLLDIRNWGIELLPAGWDCDARAADYLSGICDCVLSLRIGGSASLRCTAASQAVQQMRTRPECVRLHCHTHSAALAIERAAYYGGRCECYRLGKIPGPVYHLDVRSMYPSICTTLPVPVSLRRYHATERSRCDLGSDGGANLCAHVRVRTDQPRYPLRREGQTVYPVGRFDTSLAGPELAGAIRRGDVTAVYSCAEYTTAPVLAGFYADWLMRLDSARRSGRKMECQWIKRVMNALPGKFGEPGRQWLPALARPEHGPYGTWYEDGPDGALARHRNMGPYTMREEIHGESYWSIPAIAGFITSAGRDRLFEYLLVAGRNHVWYCDTDSLICDRIAYDRLCDRDYVRDGETGNLRLCGRFDRCHIFGIRHYTLDNTVVCAGVPRGLIEAGETREEYWLRRQIAGEVALGVQPSARRERARYPAAPKYRHGIVAADGTVSPLRIGDE